MPYKYRFVDGNLETQWMAQVETQVWLQKQFLNKF